MNQDYTGPIPSKAQLDYHKEELACFMHFGVNTYNEVEWGNGKEKLSDFELKEFDYDGYVKFIKEIGFKRLIVTAKHHDGFCLFDTKFTDHNIINTEYGKDFLKELSKSCTKYDMDMGIYLSPWDAHEPSYGKGDDYNLFYENQLEEICSNKDYGNNGKFVEWWFDGAKDPSYPDQEYNFDKWMNIVKKYNPEILMFGVGSHGGIHWIGNEMGYAPLENAPRLPKREDITIDYVNDFKSNTGHNDKYNWSVPEADTTTTEGWFSHPDEKIKSLEELNNIYLKSIGRGAVLLLNLAPNKEGKLDENLKSRITEFKESIDDKFRKSLNDSLEIREEISEDKKTVVYTITNPDEIDIKYIELMEDIEFGSRFKDGYIFINEERLNIPSIGYKRIFKIDTNQYTKNNIYSIKILLNSNFELKIKSLKFY